MATTQTFYRKATVTRAEATAALFSRFPTADLISFKQKKANASEAAAANAKVGDLVYEATLRVAEFPPSDDESSEEEPEAETESEEAPEEAPEEESSDDSESGDAPAFGGGDEGGDAPAPKKLSPDEEQVHLLQQILDALKGGAGPSPDPLGGPGDDLGLPDIGAPAPGEGLPAPDGPPSKAPLPPPVKQKSPVGVGAFAHVAAQSVVTLTRTDASEIGNRAMIVEAQSILPTHKVTKIQRTGAAIIDGEPVALAEKGIAVVTLVKQ